MSIGQIHTHARTNDVPLVALSFDTGLGTNAPLIKLVAQPLIEAETLALDTVGLRTTHSKEVGFTPKRAIGFPAWAILSDPPNARHALNLVKDVVWARRKAKSEPSKVRKHITELAGVLQASAPHFLPTFLEEIARIFNDVENASYAKQFFSKARETERNHSLSIDPQRHAHAFAEFASLGIVSAKTLSQEARDALSRSQPQEAYEYFFQLLLEQAKAGVGIYANAFKDLHFIGKHLGMSLREVEHSFIAAYVPTRSFPRSSETLLKKIVKALPELLKTQPDLAECLYTMIPQQWDADEYVRTLQKLKLWDPLRTNPDKFAQWLDLLISHGHSTWRFFAESNPDLLEAIVGNTERLTGVPIRTISVKYHLDYLDAFIAAQTDWKPIPPQYHWERRFSFDEWLRQRHRDLRYLVEQESIRDDLVKGLDTKALEHNLKTLLAGEPTRKVVEWKLQALLDQRAITGGSKAQWENFDNHRRHLDTPLLRTHFSELVEAILHIDLAEELAERLRRGTLVEYTWPLFEDQAPEILTENTHISATYPWVCLRNGRDLHTFNGDNYRKYRLPSNYHGKAIPTDNDVFYAYYDHSANEHQWMWLSEGVAHTITDNFNSHSVEEYVSVIDQTLYIGPTAITEGQLNTAPSGLHVGFNPVYAVRSSEDSVVVALPDGEKIPRKDFHAQVVTGSLPGLDVPELSAAVDPRAELDFTHSFATRVTSSTSESPFGVAGDRIFGLSFHTDEEKSVYVSPLGTFHFEHANYMALKKPGAQVWYLDTNYFWRQPTALCDAATMTAIAPALTHTGKKHVLNALNAVGFHQLRVRNQAVSTKMRQCTKEQAAQLISEPTRILDFAEGDETLAAAIAGIIVDISEIYCVQIDLPHLRSVPEPLSYLYASLEKSPVQQVNIAQPPDPMPHKTWKGSVKAVYKTAVLLNTPQRDGSFRTPWEARFLWDTLGQEMRWLAWLSGPGLPLEKVRHYHEFLTWCVDSGVLGTWRRVTVRSDSLDAEPDVFWDNFSIVERTPTSYTRFWNPDLSDEPTEPAEYEVIDDGLFVPKEEFQSALDEILAWHVNRHSTPGQLSPGWDNATIAEKAEQAAAVTTFPPQVWALLFGGGLHDYEMPFHNETTAQVSEVLAVSKNDVDSFNDITRRILPDQRWRLLALTWHKDFLSTGPDVAALADAWQRLWGKPWITLDWQHWDLIPLSLRTSLDNHFIDDVCDEPSHLRYYGPKLLAVFIHLAHAVEPSSVVACNLAERIRKVCDVTIEDPHIPLGSDFDNAPWRKSTPDEHALRLVKEGYLDSLLDYLTQGSVVEGVKEDPSVVAPAVVAEASRTLGLSSDAARYFLQLAALTRPMDNSIKKWNGWSKKQLDQVAAELVDKGLVVAAKRAGTGRSVFLPGGWLEKSDTGPAMEVWKAPHYLLWKAAKNRPIVAGCPPIVPYADLFAEVWQRYASGDIPGYEELTTERYRQRR
ncbi:MAG: hypothetical protein Q4A31_05185 [Corynebacterium sp.]|uniref:hypothetical protein n=1 Tax=Corynebacterium sp. TaxID=1720 RepID=UPI0026DBF352|nr:hypothetical protein [Corynebacterium sp.]MDO4761292.1 hypothetical protein [Corynebacterium sp.]